MRRPSWLRRAETFDTVRPDRSTVTSICTGPAPGARRYCTVSERGRRLASATSATIARSTIAATYPPFGPLMIHHDGCTCAP